jgi:hypothetical protein
MIPLRPTPLLNGRPSDRRLREQVVFTCGGRLFSVIFEVRQDEEGEILQPRGPHGVSEETKKQ